MAETANPTAAKSKKPVLIGALLGLVGAAAGFASTSGLLPVSGFGGGHSTESHGSVATIDGVSFHPLAPILVNLSNGTILRFSAQLEVQPEALAEVTLLEPRIIDVLNTYLRAVSYEDLADPLVLPRLRSHMLRRISLVVGEDKVRDLLVMEFIIN